MPTLEEYKQEVVRQQEEHNNRLAERLAMRDGRVPHGHKRLEARVAELESEVNMLLWLLILVAVAVVAALLLAIA